MMRRFVMTIAAAALIGTFIMSVRTSNAQAPNAMVQQYGYPFCAIIGNGPDSVTHDCGYVSLEQCRATAAGMGYCVENSAYIAARANAAAAPAGPAIHTRKRHR